MLAFCQVNVLNEYDDDMMMMPVSSTVPMPAGKFWKKCS